MTVLRIAGPGAARPLQGRWAVAASAPGRARCPADLDAVDPEWLPCAGPMTVAAALRAAGRWDGVTPRDFDAEEWWYRCRFTTTAAGASHRLHFEGLATIADVWLDGTPILHSTSMFVAHTVDIDALAGHDHELYICFHALEPLLRLKRARPRWRSALVARQQLRHVRTTLLGRMSTWGPPVAPVGPWRPVLIAPGSALRIERCDLRADLEGDDGVVRVAIAARHRDATIGEGVLAVGSATGRVSFATLPEGNVELHSVVRVPGAARWWPHTHGAQPLYEVRLSIDVGGDVVDLDLGRTGFRTIDVERGPRGKGFGLVVNGVPVFCRGVCWTPLDVARLTADGDDYRTALTQLRDAGMNMIRVSGTMVYESDDFHDLCDELGFLLWQDFMFANMDYQTADHQDGFGRDVAIEVEQRLAALQSRPSLAVCCGNSEVEQQAAMMGERREHWRAELFSDILPRHVAARVPAVAWLPSTPTGGAYPFQADEGVTHYYGVGAYRRSLDDVRRSDVQFAAECLAFSNIADEPFETVLAGDRRGRSSRDAASLRAPRDAGADWDFGEVRDHYVAQLFGVDPSALLESDPARYRALGRVAVGEMMLHTFAEWRHPRSSCRGGLVWFARDFTPGAGWGVIDASGRPKSVYWFLKRALAPTALFAIDEGLNGLHVHAANETAAALEASLVVSLYREGCALGGPRTTTLTVPPRGTASLHVDCLFDSFRDLTHTYRLGARTHDVVAASLYRENGELVATAYSFPHGLPSETDRHLHLYASAVPVSGGYELLLEADRFAHAVAVEADGFVPDDNYLHLEPGRPRKLMLRASAQSRTLSGRVSALNGTASVPIQLVGLSDVR